ncbi:MAG: histone deacetylase [Opitutales bacterium]
MHISTRRNFINTAANAALGLSVSPHLTAQPSDTSVSQTGLVWDDRYIDHTQGEDHPESPMRLKAIDWQLQANGIKDRLYPIAATADPEPYIRMIHSEAHIEMAKRQAYDDAICRLAVSGALSAVDAVCMGKVKNAFCALRPPGHHAANNGEYGFCFYNNVAAAARYAQKQYGLGKALIVDWDYHHGDGTEWAFYDDPSVLTCSTHALHAFPRSGATDRTGTGAGRGYNLNIPLPAAAKDSDILQAFKETLLPRAYTFKPDIVFISAGFDARHHDPLGDFNITDDGFAHLTQLIMELAQEHSEARTISLLEGGYNTHGLALAVEAHIRVLMDG